MLKQEPVPDIKRPHVGKSIAQVGLRWLQQQGVDVIPKTTHKERMQENMDIIDFELTAGEMQRIKTLDTGRSQFGWR